MTGPLEAAALDAGLHEQSPPHVRWTTVNMAEVLPGVLTPLGWSFWRDPCEAGLRAAFADTGVLPLSEAAPPERLEQRLTALFHGRLAANLDLVCELCDRMPGTSGAAFEEQMFGRADPDVPRARSRRRYPVVAAKMPGHLALLPGRLRRLRAEVDTWWRSAVFQRAEAPGVRFRQAQAMLRRSMRRHMLASLAAQGGYDQLVALAARAGRPGLELRLATGYGGMEETAVSADLWEVSRGRLALDGFLARHGYHGPNEGQLASRSWREDSRALTDLVTRYRDRAEADAPRARERRQTAARRDAETELLAALPATARPAARATLAVARRYLPLREIGKAAFLQSVDAGRAAARELGDRLAADGRIADPEDVFFLTGPEVLNPGPDLAARAAARKATHAGYLELQLPERWVGMPSAIPAAAAGEPTATVTGVPVSPGVAEGTARVVHDPNEVTDFDPGDVLVCETTDPSWVVLFQLAGAAVIDVGGAMSHGAIVARELGLPCVINTRSGTRTVPDGARVRVDGAAGRVEILND